MRLHTSTLFTLVYIGLAIVEIAAELLDLRSLVYLTKPLLTLSLLGYTVARKPLAGFPASIRWLMAGLLFALAGDVFLMLREFNGFLFGLGAFLLMQLCYILSFRLSMRSAPRTLRPGSSWIRAVPFAGYLLAFLAVLQAPLEASPALRGLKLPIILYGTFLCAMGWMASVRQVTAREPGGRWVLIGALWFILSDSILAYNRFVAPIPASALLIMGTYAAAQYFIVRGMQWPR